MKEAVPKRLPEYLDFVYRELLSLLKLQERHRQDFKRRGAADIEIKELEQKGYKSIQPENSVSIAEKLLEKGLRLDGIPGFFRNRSGIWEAAFYEGNQGYLWFTSSGFSGGTSSGSPAGVSGYISPVQRSIHVTEGILKAELASLRSGYPYIGIPGVGNYKSLLPVLADLKSRGLQTVYECMDMDKMMDLTCRCDCMEKCIVCGTPERLLRKQECPQKRRKRDTIRKGCLKLYDMCERLGLNCQRISWDTDADGLWLGNYKGVDDWIYSKSLEEKESFY